MDTSPYAQAPDEAPGPQDVATRFLACVRDRPDAIAVSDRSGRALTYRELGDLAIVLAHRIQALQGTAKRSVAVVADRSCHLVAAVTAAAVSGSPCVVLSPAMWRSDLARATAEKIVLAEARLAKDFPRSPTIAIDEGHALEAELRDAGSRVGNHAKASDPLAVVHSTGESITRAALAKLAAALDEHELPAGRVAQVSDPLSRTFPFEVWAALARGGSICIAPESTGSTEALASWLLAEAAEQRPASIVLATPTASTLIARHAPALEATSGMLLLGTGIEPDQSRELARLAGSRPVLVALSSPDAYPVWLGRVEATARGGVIAAVGRPIAGASLEATAGDGDGAVALGELGLRRSTGDLQPLGARGRRRPDGRWEVCVSVLTQPELSLSYSQQRVWFFEQLDSGRGIHNLPLSYRIRGPLDLRALEHALSEVIGRHEVLHSVFPARQGTPRQVVHPHAPIQIPVTDLTGAPDAEQLARQLAQDEARSPFDLAAGPVVRARLLRFTSVDHLFLLSIHNIACDAWSLAIIGRELGLSYRAHLEGASAAPLPRLELQYADFAERQSGQLSDAKRRELVDYWRAYLAGSPACINLPVDRPRPPVQSYEGDFIELEVPRDTVARAEVLAGAEGTTLSTVLLGAFAATLQRYNGSDDIVIGTPVANRNEARSEPVVGLFSSTLVVRLPVTRHRSFSELTRAVTAEVRGALAHQDLPFELLVEELPIQRDIAHSPVFQVMFAYEEGDRGAPCDLAGCEVTATIGESGTSRFDLTLHLTRTASALHARLEYATALFDEATAERIGAHFLTLLGQAVADPRAELASLEVLPEAERRLVVQEWAHGRPVESTGDAVHHLIARQAERTPGAPAVVDGVRTLTYGELESAASAFAGRLQALGVRPGSIVGVYLDRSVHTVVALLGILKAGGAYLPLDPGYPPDRLAFMVSDSGAGIVASRRALLGDASALGAEAVAVDATRAAPASFVAGPVTPEDLAYVIYTSGSTGRPKGVKISHRNLAAFLAAMDSTFGDDRPGTWLAVTSISFDISVLELLWTLTRGYRVVVRGDEPVAARAPAGAPQRAHDVPAPERPVEFSLFFFGNVPAGAAAAAKRYQMVFEAVQWADEQGFTAAWTPERHFHAFGGLYPNPSVLAAALAARTKRISIRAGSVVLPLHEPLRVAEEWALVDNLSSGRVGVSFASGWQPDDFVLAPDRYASRKQAMLDGIDEVRRLWRGERVRRRNGVGAEIEVAVYPRPIQQELPFWITSAQHPDTFRTAGEIGANILTHLVGHTIDDLAAKLALYRTAWRDRGHPGRGHVTLMLHTFVGEDVEQIKQVVRQPLKDYIRTSYDLMAGLGVAKNIDMRQLPANELDELLDRAFERFFETSGLLGTAGAVADRVERLAAIGVDEVGCLIDFGVEDDDALAALKHLATARSEYLRRRSERLQFPDATESIASQLRRYDVTHLQCTPSLAGVLVEDAETRGALRALRRLLVGGEALPPELAAALTSSVGGSVHNMYGPTEATVWATTSQVQAGESPVIGRPLPGYRAYVVDAALRPVPIGVPGELLLGGDAVSAGYHERAELTRDKFLPDHLSGHPGDRLYRTGDIARWRAPGELEFLGRVDHQVKLRGRRIELGEIEAALAKHAAIQGAVCDVRGDGDAKRIVAYLVAAREPLPTADELRSFLGESLPEYMVPAAYVRVESFPLTPNGKTDRRALPDPDQAPLGPAATFRAPTGELEQMIASVWQQVLRTERVGRDDNFFSIGGNSILVVAVRSRLLERTGTDLSVVDLFRYPTVAALAAALAARSAPQQAQHAVAARAAEAGERRRAAARRAGPAAKGPKT